jgi:serine/threonine protein kinase
MLLTLLGIGLIGLAIYRSYILNSSRPPYEKIRLPDGRILEGPNKVLGKGAFGTVCCYHLDHRPVAVKIPASKEYNELQASEITLLKRANPHINIIKFLGEVEVSGKLWILMELMGGTVRDLLDQKPRLSSKTKMSIAIQMTTGIAHLHKLSSTFFTIAAIVHQDLKPDNLLVDRLDDDPSVAVKISDFGIARQVDEITIPIFGKISSKLHEGLVGGTLLYMAPEVVNAVVLRSDNYEPKADIFSLGLILWEIATTKRPNRSQQEIIQGTFQEFTADQKILKKRVGKTAFFGVPTEPVYPRSSFFGPIIDKCIRARAGDRISASNALERLQQVV